MQLLKDHYSYFYRSEHMNAKVVRLYSMGELPQIQLITCNLIKKFK